MNQQFNMTVNFKIYFELNFWGWDGNIVMFTPTLKNKISLFHVIIGLGHIFRTKSFEPNFLKLSYLVPFFSQAQQAHHDGIRGRSFLWLQLYLGLAWTVGCIFFGAVADNRWLQLWSFGTYRPLFFQKKRTFATDQKWFKEYWN